MHEATRMLLNGRTTPHDHQKRQMGASRCLSASPTAIKRSKNVSSSMGTFGTTRTSGMSAFFQEAVAPASGQEVYLVLVLLGVVPSSASSFRTASGGIRSVSACDLGRGSGNVCFHPCFLLLHQCALFLRCFILHVVLFCLVLSWLFC